MEDQYTFFVISRSVHPGIRNVPKEFVEKIKHMLYSITFFSENRVFYNTMWNNIVEPGKPEMPKTHAPYMIDTKVYKYTLRTCNIY
jgi:hypothetical protein